MKTRFAIERVSGDPIVGVLRVTKTFVAGEGTPYKTTLAIEPNPSLPSDDKAGGD